MSIRSPSLLTILHAAPHPRRKAAFRRARQDLFRSTLHALMTARLRVPADAADSD
jgi:hypothetical protein